ncbi:hypothetical protein [Streptomyces yaizuensis]|uniref:Nuclear transport factor 2 family protein n=1 Tax=Streptomyces yaizuensis TaxID=2989713 RepID=A0ABQ5P728_9ACTN|nr:hypothetical protein [Streptomyces sp. YSPA8]GLF98389.1 nuclear transport factor 2 family protein [Streptomyces sp. YSPA8]
MTDTTTAAVDRSPAPVTPPAPRRPARWHTPAVVCAVLALLLTGTALLYESDRLRDTPAARDLALTDAAATDEAADAVADTVTRIFSYTPDDTGATREDAARLLAGTAARQYAELFGQVEREAAGQRLTLTTHVVRTGVVKLTDRRADVLLFLDQVAERRGRDPVTTAAQLSVTAERRSGRWLVTHITSR